MKINPIYIIRYLCAIYGGKISYKDDCFYVEIDTDKFRVNLTDKKRFGYYTFFHRDSGRRLDGKYYYHTQLKDKDLAHGLLLVWCHKFNKDVGIWSTHEDWLRLVNDAYKYNVYLEEEYENIESLCKAGIQNASACAHQVVVQTS